MMPWWLMPWALRSRLFWGSLWIAAPAACAASLSTFERAHAVSAILNIWISPRSSASSHALGPRYFKLDDFNTLVFSRASHSAVRSKVAPSFILAQLYNFVELQNLEVLQLAQSKNSF
jgi:hypothetical protein